ncbi:MAG TPA: hypothetical protein VFR56_05645 [Actinomycetes bacterium]|nr:hypothetical protein [Actinomycetes bacterium]
MTDLETRVRDTLTDHAGAAGPWQVSGSALRATAAHRRTRRLRAATALGATAAAIAVVAGVSLATGGGTDGAPLPGATDRPSSGPTSSPTTEVTGSAEPRPELLQVPVADDLVQQAVSTFALDDSELLASATLPGSGDTLLVFRGQLRGDDSGAVVQTVTAHRSELRAGTLTLYRPGADLVAQPARDGDGATLVVIAPPGSDADSVDVTTSLPGKDIDVRSADLRDGLALVELPGAQSATRLRLLRQGTTVLDSIPGDYHFGASVPRPLGRVVAETGEYERVQVRTNGRSACRVTVTDLEGRNPFLTPWNPIDEGCVTIDPDRLQLLVPDDRRSSSVAGLAPTGTSVVRLVWRVGKDTESNDVRVTRSGGAIAFIDTSMRSPDQLIRAEAWSSNGDVLATVLP